MAFTELKNRSTIISLSIGHIFTIHQQVQHNKTFFSYFLFQILRNFPSQNLFFPSVLTLKLIVGIIQQNGSNRYSV